MPLLAVEYMLGGSRLQSKKMADLFISYAREDDEPFVERLYHDLTSTGADVWWDRKVMPNRGRTFLQELRDGIEGSERVLAVLGPKALESEYVLVEWEHARLFAKGVVFAVRIGSFEDIPEPFGSYHAIDFRDDKKYGARLDDLRSIMSTRMVPLGEFRTSVPALPPRFQMRSEPLQSLADSVLTDVHRPTVVTSPKQTSVVQGMGGIGKSVLAAAFARNVDTRRAFEDGIVWVTIGVHGTPLEAMRALGRALDDDPDHYLYEQAATDAIPSLLEPLMCLIVLDDVWEIRHVTPFVNALGPRCRLLITTRQKGIARSFDVQEHPISVLSKAASLRLLSDWCEQSLDDMPSEASEVARQCGYLPFALALCGAMARGGTSWSDLNAALDKSRIDFPRHEFPNYEDYPDLLHCIGVSIERLERDDPTAAGLYRWLVVFPPDEQIPEQAVMHVWSEENGLEDFERRRILTELDSRALIRLEGAEPKRRVHLHDVLLDYLRVKCTDLRERHQKTVDLYRRKGNSRWEAVPDDGYFLGHLAYHLREASLAEDLYRLVDRGWMEVRFAQVGTHEGFLADIEILIEVAGAEEPPRLYEEIRGSLAAAMISTYASSVPFELLTALTLIGRSRVARGLAKLDRDPNARAEGFRAIAKVLGRQGQKAIKAADELIEEALGAIRDQRFTRAKTEFLAWAASEWAYRGEQRRARRLAYESLGLAQEETHPAERLWAFAHSAESLRSAGERKAHLKVVRETMDAAEHSIVKSEILSELAVSLARTNDYKAALRITKKLRPTDCVAALCRLVPEFVKQDAKKSLESALRRARDTAERLTGDARAGAMAGISTVLFELGRFDEAETAARTALNAGPGFNVAPVARALARVGVFGEARALVENADWLRDLADYDFLQGLLEAGALGKAVEVVSEPGFRWKAQGFGRIAVGFAEDGKAERAAELADQGLAESIDLCLAAKVHMLCGVMIALARVEANERCRTSQRLAHKTFEQLVGQWDRIPAACALGSALWETGAEEDALEVIAQARFEIGTSSYYATSLVELAAVLLRAKRADEAGKFIDQSLELAEVGARQPVVGRANPYPYSMALTLSDIGRFLAGTDLAERGRQIVSQAFDLAKLVADPKEKATLNARLAYAFASFGDTDRANALAIELFSTDKIWRGFGQHTVLNPLTKCLTILGDREKLHQALRISRLAVPSFGPDVWSQLPIIGGLAKIGDLETALESASKIQGTKEHAQALVQVAIAMPDADLERAVGLVRAAARGARLHGRASLISVLGVGSAILTRIDQGETLWRVCEAVFQVDSWWTTKDQGG